MDLVPGNIEVTIYTPPELEFSCYFITGLFELNAQNKIKCNVNISLSTKRGLVWVNNGTISRENRQHIKTCFYKLKDKSTHKEVSFAVDSYDFAEGFCERALNECKYLFKKNYNKEIADALMKKYPARILPLGLIFGVRSKTIREQWKFFVGFMGGFVLRNLKFDSTGPSRLAAAWKKGKLEWGYFLKKRDIEDHRRFEEADQNKVILQTRCFPGVDDHTQQLHKDRNDLITALKKGLGAQFIGGFVPDANSRKLFPDNLTNLPTDPAGYLKLVKSASIGIYVRGLQFAPAFKMGEYLSQGKCIVSEPLTAELPVPLENGKNIMFFKDPQDCVTICQELIANPGKQKQLAAGARAYYEAYVDPAINVERVLKILVSE